MEHMPQDVPKSESPEQDNIVYSIPPSYPSTPRGQTVSRTEGLLATFLKPSLPVAKTKTPVREISSDVSSSKKTKLFADRTSEGSRPESERSRPESEGKCRSITQNCLGVLTSATSIGSKAFSSRKPPRNVWDVVESDEEDSHRMDLVHSVKRLKQHCPTAADSLTGPRLFSQVDGSSTRSPFASRNVLDNAQSRRGSTTNLTSIEDLNLNRSTRKRSDHALEDMSVTKNTMPRAIYPNLEEARMENLRPSEQDNTQPTNSVADSLSESDSNDQQTYEEIISEGDSDKILGVIKPTVEHGMDVDVEMTLIDEHGQSDIHYQDQALNTGNDMGKGTNDEQEAVKNSLDIMIENSDAEETSTIATVTKQTQSPKEFAPSINHKEAKETTIAERKAKKAYNTEIEKKERVRKAHELEEQQKTEVSRQNEKRCIGTPAAARFQQKSITSPIPGPNPRRSALKSSTALRSSSISLHDTPSRNMHIDSQTPIPCTLQPSPVVVSRSVSFADAETKEVKASGKLNTNVKINMKSKEQLGKASIKSTEPAISKNKPPDRMDGIKKILAARRVAEEKMTVQKKMEDTKPAKVKTKPVTSKGGKIIPETIQTELKVIRDKGKKPVYDPPSPPKPILSQVGKDIEVDEGNLFDMPLPYLGDQPGPSKSRSSSAIVSSKDKEGSLPTLKEAPGMTRSPSAGSVSEGVKATRQLPRDDRSESASRSPAREVVSSDSSRSGSESDSESQSDSDIESEHADKDEGKEEVNDGGRNGKLPGLTSADRSKKATVQTTTLPVPVDVDSSSESETDSDDGELPPMKLQSRSKSPSESDSRTGDDDNQSTRRSLSLRDGTASGSASIVDEAERQLQREIRQSMEPSRSSQIHPPPKTPTMAGLSMIAQQAKKTNLLSSEIRLPNQRLHSLSSMIKGTSTPMVTAGKRLPAYKLPSMKAMVGSMPKGSTESVPVDRLRHTDSQSSSEDEDDDEDDDDDTDEGRKGSAGKGFLGLMKRKL